MKHNGRAAVERIAGIGSEAVAKATGKGWDEWCRILDRDGADKMEHKDIARLLAEKHGVRPWWSQMVTVGYEQARGLRAPQQSCRGDYQASVSKTVEVPVSRLFAAWKDARSRAGWLGKRPLVVRKANIGKSLRITWPDDTSVEVNFYAKGSGKSQVAVQHKKLVNKGDVARVKEIWSAALAKLKENLENGASRRNRANETRTRAESNRSRR